MAIDLNKNLSLPSKGNKKKKAGKVVKITVPTKRHINFASVGKKEVNKNKVVIITVVVVLFLAVFGKFGIYDKFAAVNQAQQLVDATQAELDAGYAKINSYEELNEKYAHYTTSDMTQDELKLVDRNEVLDLIYKTIMSKVSVDTWTINGNVIDLTITGSTLQELNQLAGVVREDKIVSLCTVQTASKDEEKTDVTATLTVYLKDFGGESNE